MADGARRIRVNDIGEYIRHKSCDRRFYLTVNHDQESKALPFFDRLLNQFEPILARVGRQHEEQWKDELEASGFVDAGKDLPKSEHNGIEWHDLTLKLADLPEATQAYAREVRVEGDIGAFWLSGQIDFILIRKDNGRVRFTLVECKASRRDRTYHRLQVATYRMLLRQKIGNRGIQVGQSIVPTDAIECMVVRIDASRNANQSMLSVEPLDLESVERDIERLLARDGRLDRTLSLPLTEIGYQIDSKCDGCLYNVHCLAESARLRRSELIGLDPVCSRMLNQAGLNTIDLIASPPLLRSPEVEALLRNPGFEENFQQLRHRARARRHTLPPNAADIEQDFDVESMPFTGAGHLPAHDGPAGRLLRIYLAIDHDYSENRIGAMTAHITGSDGRLTTDRHGDTERWQADPDVREQTADGSRRPLQGQDLIEYKATPWLGNNDLDSEAERELIQRFFEKLVRIITEEAGAASVPIHFYVWSASEIRYLIEACCRVGSNMLGSVQQLLGCREGLEQQIYSSIQAEIDRRYALGWTGRGLSVVASLRWFGRRYHWIRRIHDKIVDLDKIFSQNIFDFKIPLELDSENNWASPDHGHRHLFEVRSRFLDSLPAAYWHAVWGTLPSPEIKDDNRLKSAIERYNRVRNPEVLKSFLIARCHALRWLEESITPKNREIEKPAILIAELPTFHLDRDELSQAAIDFLRLDQSVKLSSWTSEHLLPPIVRVPRGRTLPLRNVNVASDKKTITGKIDLAGFDGLMLSDLQNRSVFASGSFVRLSPWNGDPVRGQSVNQLTSAVGRTCIIQSLDWKTGHVRLEGMYAEADNYTLASGSSRNSEVLFSSGYATLDESVTDFVARRVDARLQKTHEIQAWFDHLHPRTPELDRIPSESELATIRELVASFPLPPSGRLPEVDQVQAVLDGLTTRVQLLQGPPGTGKTTTTALAILTRVLTASQPGDILFLSAHTHRALDELMTRLNLYLQTFSQHVGKSDRPLLPIRLVKAHSGEPTENVVGGSVDNLPVSALKSQKRINELKSTGVLILGGTTAGLLKLAKEFGTPARYNGGKGLEAKLLVVDEASMMVFPHFLALATLLDPRGQILLTGDHRQLAPITAHDWENEDRPPTVLYQPFVSAFEAVRRIADTDAIPGAAVRRSALQRTFRLPPIVRNLIAGIYRQDRIELTGPDRQVEPTQHTGDTPWHEIWRWSMGLYLIVHNEDCSKRSNELELEIVNEILRAAPDLPPSTVAVITPHRAQRSLLQAQLAVPHGEGKAVDTIDTVERLQGGERANVIVSATVSDPTAIETNAEFILDLNRTNVAFSRAQQRLIVICAQTLLDHIPSEIETYTSAMLWKALRDLCTVEVKRLEIKEHSIKLLVPNNSNQSQ